MPHVPPYLVLNISPAKDLFSFLLLLHPLWRVTVFTLLFLTLALLASRTAEQIFTRQSLFSQFARRRNLVVLSLFFAVIGIRLAILPLLPMPVPGIHD